MSGTDKSAENSASPMVHTACGGVIQVSEASIFAIYQGETIYFCMSECKTDFEKDPEHSCLALRGMS